MPKRNENLKRLLEFCDDNGIDIGDIQQAQEDLRWHEQQEREIAKGREMDGRLKFYATIVGLASTLIIGAWRLFSTEATAQQAHIENQAQATRLQAIEQTVSQQSVQIAVQNNQYQNLVGQLSTIQSQQNEIIRILNERYAKK